MLTVRLSIKLILILLFSYNLTGCVNLKAVGKFADGVQALSEASGKFYDQELATDRKLAVMTVSLNAKQERPECKKTDGAYLTPWECETRGENLMSEARRNRAAITALAQYAHHLKELAEFNDDENVEKSAKELSGNLNSLAKTLDAADPKESILATAISGLAKTYIDLRIRNVIYEKVKLAHDDVSTIIHTLKTDIEREKKRLDISRENATATREEWFNAFRKLYQNNEEIVSSKKISSHEKDRLNFENANILMAAGSLVDEELTEKLAVQPNLFFLNKLNEAADSCLEAHKAIQNPNLNDKSGTLIKFINDAQNLLASFKQFNN